MLFRVQPHSAQSPETAMKSSRAIAVIDPFSTGAVLAYEVSQKGFKVYAGKIYFPSWSKIALFPFQIDSSNVLYSLQFQSGTAGEPSESRSARVEFVF